MPVRPATAGFTEKSLENLEKTDGFLAGGDLILLLLSVSPIRGRTKLQKQVFLTWKNIFNREVIDPGFFPHESGAYSRTVEDSTHMLQGLGLIKIKPGRDEGMRYSITPKGKRSISEKIRTSDISLERIKGKKSDWDELTTRGIIRLVCRNFPEYMVDTGVPDLPR